MRSSVLCTRTGALALALASLLVPAGCGSSSSSITRASASQADHTSAAVAGRPVLGYTWSAGDHSLRTLAGVPGAAVVGAALFTPGRYTAGAASVRLQSALLEDAAGRVWLAPLGPGGVPQQLASGQPQGLAFRWAPAADSAALYAPGGRNVLVLSKLSTEPEVDEVGASAGVLAAAVADDGTLAVATADGRLSVRTPGGRLSNALTVPAVGGMAFLGGGRELAYADAARNQVALLDTTAGTATTIAAATDGVNAPAALAVSGDQHWAAVVNGADRILVRIDLNGVQGTSRISCGCTASMLAPLAANGVFQLTGSNGAGPVWAVDIAAATPRTFFIPTPQQAGTAGSR